MMSSRLRELRRERLARQACVQTVSAPLPLGRAESGEPHICRSGLQPAKSRPGGRSCRRYAFLSLSGRDVALRKYLSLLSHAGVRP